MIKDKNCDEIMHKMLYHHFLKVDLTSLDNFIVISVPSRKKRQEMQREMTIYAMKL
jgi:hypothetical protein